MNGKAVPGVASEVCTMNHGSQGRDGVVLSGSAWDRYIATVAEFQAAPSEEDLERVITAYRGFILEFAPGEDTAEAEVAIRQQAGPILIRKAA